METLLGSVAALLVLLGDASGCSWLFQETVRACARADFQQTYGVTVEMVTVYATVRDRQGRLTTALNHDDFLLYDNGLPQAISQFSREYQPLSAVILLDNSFSMSGRALRYAKQGLLRFLERLDPRDEAMLMSFRAGSTVVQPFTRDPALIRRSLGRLEAADTTALYDAILEALKQSQRSQNKRRALLLISDGINTYGQAELDGTVAQLRRRGAEIFAIGLQSSLPDEQHSGRRTRAVLDTLTRSAGGESFLAQDPSQLKGICDLISDRLHNQYTLSYYPLGTQDGQWHSIRIESKVPGYEVVASKAGYYSGEPRF
jgi:Ca-activated chloride channel family protein